MDKIESGSVFGKLEALALKDKERALVEQAKKGDHIPLFKFWQDKKEIFAARTNLILKD